MDRGLEINLAFAPDQAINPAHGRTQPLGKNHRNSKRRSSAVLVLPLAVMLGTGVSNLAFAQSTDAPVISKRTAPDGTTIVQFADTRPGTAEGDEQMREQDQARAAGYKNKSDLITAFGNADMSSWEPDTGVALGDTSSAFGVYSLAAGSSSTAAGDGSTAAGNYSFAGGTDSSAYGNHSFASGAFSTAAGAFSNALGSFSTAYGNGAFAGQAFGTAVGNWSSATGYGSTAIGDASLATNEYSTAVGESSRATGIRSSAYGVASTAAGDNSTAIGDFSNAAADTSTALGSHAIASAANSVALGQGSLADQANTVSVGSASDQRRITNVAAGTQGTDAVNVNQLNGDIGKVQSQFNNNLTQAQNQLNGRISQVQNWTKSYVDQKTFGVSRAAYSGIAGATALTMIPEVEAGKTFAVGVGVGQYKGYSASAVGISARVSSNIKLKAGLGFSSNGNTAGVGASYQW
jgi:trimeric autotransporter adhesin